MTTVFQGWENFYFMIGSSGASLIGLLFVVVTLTSGGDAARLSRGQRLFMTPTALAFALVLAVSAVALAPGLPRAASAALISAMAAGSFINGVRVSIDLKQARSGGDVPHWSDFYMYGLAPVAIDACLVAAAIAAGADLPGSAHCVAALLMAHLMVALRNAWDLVTWIAPRRPGATGGPPS